jgi:ubiquitin-protein ligase
MEFPEEYPTKPPKVRCHTTDTAMMRQLQQCKNGARCKLTVDQDRRLTDWLGL